MPGGGMPGGGMPGGGMPGGGMPGGGMMGGGMPGGGMMGGGMMGGGMMGGGMMGGGMMGGGMMGGGHGAHACRELTMMGSRLLHTLDLNDQQIAKINQIRDEVRRKNWNTQGKLIDEQARMRDLLLADKRDPSAIGQQAMKIADLRRQLLEARIDAYNRIETVLTKEQKEQLRGLRRSCLLRSDE